MIAYTGLYKWVITGTTWNIMSVIPQWVTITYLYQQLATCPLFNSEHGLISQAIKFLIVQLVARPNASQEKKFLH